MSLNVLSMSVVDPQLSLTISLNDVEAVFVAAAPAEGFGMLAVRVIVYNPTSDPRVGEMLKVLVDPLSTMNGAAITEPPLR